jgi:iron-sulfur cluster protein
MTSDTQERAAEIRRLLAEEGDPVSENTRGFNEGRYETVAQLEDYQGLKDRARRIKEDAIERLPELIEEVTDAVEANGGTVYLADDAAEANRYVRQVVDRSGDTVVKSKSMTTEEIALNDALRSDGVEVWETDLGEFVLQVADEAPSHIVAPAIHKSRDAIAELFNSQFDPDTTLETAAELTRFAREYLGEEIRDADVGVTGANFIAADSGTMALVTSEGNARKCIAAPDTHVAVAGVEKLVPSVRDFQPFVELIGRSGTGQDITSYVSLFSPPVESPPIDFEASEEPGFGGTDPTDREFHLVLLDNGRTEMRDDAVLRETLYCIRCSACLNSCGNFQSVGGHAFGGETYSGGIATGWEAGVHGTGSAAEFNDLCTGCSRCVNQCPVKIDIPWINTAIRDRVNRGKDPDAFDHIYAGLTPDEEPAGLDLRKRFFGNFETVASLASATAPLSNLLATSTPSRLLLEQGLGIDRRRDLPSFQRETLTKWFTERGGSQVDDPARTTVLYPDLYTNHVHVERGKAAVRTLEALDVGVEIPACGESGRAPLSQGMISTARSAAERVHETLAPHLDDGRDIVVIEPSDLAMFRREYEKLLPPDQYERLSSNSHEIMEYVFGLLENGADIETLSTGPGRIAYHAHCQQRTLGLEAHTTAVLEAAGYEVDTSDVECCGMAGSFGYKTEYFELSMDVGEQLGEQFADRAERGQDIVASGTSCVEQLDSLLGDPVTHPVELVAPDPHSGHANSNPTDSTLLPFL